MLDGDRSVSSVRFGSLSARLPPQKLVVAIFAAKSDESTPRLLYKYSVVHGPTSSGVTSNFTPYHQLRRPLTSSCLCGLALHASRRGGIYTDHAIGFPTASLPVRVFHS